MAKASKKSPEEKLRVVLSVLRGEQSAVDAGRRAGVSEQTVHNWKKLFLDSGRDGPAMKSAAVARWFAHRAHFTHVRTRHRSPHTNGVIERWFEALKYERLYREDIADGIDLA